MALRNIRHHPEDDVLRKVSREVDRIDDRIRALLPDMTETMHAANGAGGVRISPLVDGSNQALLKIPALEKPVKNRLESIHHISGCQAAIWLEGKNRKAGDQSVNFLAHYFF